LVRKQLSARDQNLAEKDDCLPNMQRLLAPSLSFRPIKQVGLVSIELLPSTYEPCNNSIRQIYKRQQDVGDATPTNQNQDRTFLC
jgi:hypothetical protein